MSAAWGSAMCPADEWNDPELREEMTWHALEQALIGRYGRDLLPMLTTVLDLVRPLNPAEVPDAGREATWDLGAHGAVHIAAGDDTDLIEAGFPGTLDLVVTLVPA